MWFHVNQYEETPLSFENWKQLKKGQGMRVCGDTFPQIKFAINLLDGLRRKLVYTPTMNAQQQ